MIQSSRRVRASSYLGFAPLYRPLARSALRADLRMLFLKLFWYKVDIFCTVSKLRKTGP